MTHQTVLLTEAVAGLAINPEGFYIDATFGRGGHSEAILQQLGPSGRLLAIDQDPLAIATGMALAQRDSRLIMAHASFTELEKLVRQHDHVGQVAGILLDLGVSSPQLDDPQRGFSFRFDGPLDMRMNPTAGISAATWLAHVAENELARVIREYGEEKFAKRIAAAIVAARVQAPITTTSQLAAIVAQAQPFRDKHKHPATRVFQAIRIYINGELDALATVLTQSLRVLAKGGRLVVISFHSLEDRLVKRFMRQHSQSSLPARLVVPKHEIHVEFKVLHKPLRASAEEVATNPRARSAIMRIGEKQE